MTKIITISPQFVFVNNTKDDLHLVQRDSEEGIVQNLVAGGRCVFSWTSNELAREAYFKPADSEWFWCTSFKLEEIGSLTVMSFHT